MAAARTRLVDRDGEAICAQAPKLAEAGFAVFPCRHSEAAACPGGFKAAARGPEAARELSCRYPGPLVGIPTGEATGYDVLDVDGPRHPEAAMLAATRLHRTRSGGVHPLFRHCPSLRCWTSRPVSELDGRSTGGRVVWWPTAVHFLRALRPWLTGFDREFALLSRGIGPSELHLELEYA